MTKFVRYLVLVVIVLAVILPAILLVVGALPYKIYAVRTGSMKPTIPPKSAVVVKKGEYRLGQVVAFDTPYGVVTHRLVKVNPDGTLGTKGDANQTVDPRSLPRDKVIGGVVAAPKSLGYWLVYIKNPAGFASIVLTIVLLWLAYSVTMDLANAEPKKPKPIVEPIPGSIRVWG